MEANSSSNSPRTPTTTVTGKETAGTPPPCRWNPTKEQINMLENLYKQGVRTPTAEQIQEITTKLQTFGHIEGKNVFYWFQNHKARQRQKQKQDHISYYNQYLHYHHHQVHHQQRHQLAVTETMFPVPHHPNVVYGHCYMPQSDLGFYTQCPKMLLPKATTIKRRSPRTTKQKLTAGAGILIGGNNSIKSKMANGKTYQQTLDLFPLQPTGVLQQKEAIVNDGNSCATDVFTSNSADPSHDQLYFDFFSG